MRPYQNIKLTEGPDVGDIRAEGRKSSVGRIRRGVRYTDFVRNQKLGATVYKVRHNDRGYNRSKHKAIIRRNLKRADRNREDKFNREAE